MIAKNPVRALVATLITSLAGLLVAFGVELTDAQTAAFGQFALTVVMVGELARAHVTPAAKL